MTLIELLELLTKWSDGFTKKQREDAYALIADLKKQNAFSNVALSIEGEHEHVWRYVEAQYFRWNPRSIPGHYICTICNKRKD